MIGLVDPDILRANFGLLILAAVVAVLIFLLDIMLPLGVAGGVPYVLLILIGYRAHNIALTYTLAVTGTILTGVGLAASPEGSEMWMVLTNRGLALMAIWTVAFFATARMRSMRDLLRADKDLTESNDALREALDSKSYFFAAANHDMRQPAQAIDMLIAQLRLQSPNPAVLEISNKLALANGSLQDVLQGVLRIGELDSGTVTVHISDFDIDSVLDPLRAQFEPLAMVKALQFTIDPIDAIIRGDRHLLTRVLQNLLGNALRYTKTGSISLTCHQSGEKLQIAVSDTGAGISAEQLPFVFDDYYQVQNQQRDKLQGSGLGLAIVKRTLDLMDMDITVESTPGKGSTFSIEVDIACEKQAGPKNGNSEECLRKAEE